MSSHSRLKRLFSPKNVAVVGGGVWCRSVIEQLFKIGYKGEIFPVHPEKKEILGLKSFKDLDDIPHRIDATFVGVNRTATIEIVGKLNSINAGGAVCFASGFLEAENDKKGSGELQKSLIDAAADMPLLGRNCWGRRCIGLVFWFCIACILDHQCQVQVQGPSTFRDFARLRFLL